jgi:predicted glutamine amidotransferase
MCVAILRTPAGKLSDAVLKACFENNSHGAGFAFAAKGKVAVRKGYFTFDDFLTAFRPVEEEMGDKGPMLVHFRISTGGTKTALNCHPFLFKHGALIHNGHFFSVSGDESDTNTLVKAIGDDLTRTGVRLHKEALEKSFGKGNKVALLYNDASYEIINESEGHWIDGNWFSNDYWKYRLEGPRTVNGMPNRRLDGLRIPDSALGTPYDAAQQRWEGRGIDYHSD